MDDTQDIVEALRLRYPNLNVRNDICYATTNRQAAAKKLAKQVDLVLVIGAQNSSNCHRLREGVQATGIPAYLIGGPEEITAEHTSGSKRVGIVSGASTPEYLVEAVAKKLRPEEVLNISVVDEDVTFILPRELR